MIIKRVGQSTNRLTCGDTYEVNSSGYIKDDNGRNMKPEVHMCDYWEITNRAPHNHRMCRCSTVGINENQIEDKKMLKIETVVMINNQRLETFKDDTLIGYIQKEEDNIERLKEIKVKSKAIDSLKEKHKDNIKTLVEILDSRED